MLLSELTAQVCPIFFLARSIEVARCIWLPILMYYVFSIFAFEKLNLSNVRSAILVYLLFFLHSLLGFIHDVRLPRQSINKLATRIVRSTNSRCNVGYWILSQPEKTICMLSLTLFTSIRSSCICYFSLLIEYFVYHLPSSNSGIFIIKIIQHFSFIVALKCGSQGPAFFFVCFPRRYPFSNSVGAGVLLIGTTPQFYLYCNFPA